MHGNKWLEKNQKMTLMSNMAPGILNALDVFENNNFTREKQCWLYAKQV